MRMPLRGLEYSHRNHSPVEGFCRSLMGRGGIRAGCGDKYPQIARFNVLRTGIGQYVQHIGLGGNVAVLGGSPGEVRQRQILLAPQTVPQELAVIGSHGPRPSQDVHGLHTLVGIFYIQVQCAQEARHHLVWGIQGQVSELCQRSGQCVQCHLHISSFLSLISVPFVSCRLSHCWRRWLPCSTRRRHAPRSTARSSHPRRCTSRRRAFHCSSSSHPCRYGECHPRRPAWP